MANDEEQKVQESQQETPTETKEAEVDKSTPEPSQKTSSLSEDQITTLKDSITKDVSGTVSQEVSKSVIQKIGDALGLTKEEEEELPKDAESLKKVVNDAVQAKVEELNEKAQEEEQQTQQQRQQNINKIVQGWNSQYNMLSQKDKVPAIKDPSDKDDPGVQARRKIILHIGKMIDNLKQQGSDYTPSISDALLDNPNILEGPAGSDLPISGNTSSTSSDADFKYEEIAGKTFEDIATGA